MTLNQLSKDDKEFQHTAARRRLLNTKLPILIIKLKFQHTAARRRLPLTINQQQRGSKFQHTAARRRLPHHQCLCNVTGKVSTHSRPEVAALSFDINDSATDVFQHTAARRWLQIMVMCHRWSANCFNTQPPGGGCFLLERTKCPIACFNTQPPGGGCSLHKKARKISVLNTVFR